MDYSTTVSGYEQAYAQMLDQVMSAGVEKQTRNAKTKSLFGMRLSIDMSDSPHFPILQARKMYPNGVLGEFAAMLRGPKHVDDFKEFGCNYWGDWADEDGNLNVDYGNSWIDWNGVNQLEVVAETLKTNPNDRRMLVTGWRPDLVPHQSLPCCHMLYQWRVADGYLDMIWYQRSVDMMVGLPSDVILAAIWNIMLANEVGLKPGNLIFMLGDCHVYDAHYKAYEEYRYNVETLSLPPTYYNLKAPVDKKLQEFVPEDIEILFNPGPKVNLKVLA